MESGVTKRWRVVPMAAAAAVLLHGCTSGSETAGIDRSGVRVPIAAHGPITGFGSIIVNGVHYGVDAAAVSVNGEPAAVSDLALGQLVTVVGERDAEGVNGEADSVAFDSNVEGPVQALDVANGSLVVLGQTITMNEATVISLGARPPRVDSLVVGERVQVSGFVTVGGTILATRVAERSPTARLRVRGMVTNLDRARSRFRLNDLTVDYSAAVLIDGFPGGAPSNGDGVVVEGERLNAGDQLHAEELVRDDDDFEPEEGEEAEIEGLITRFVSNVDFDVAGSAVTTSAATVYEGGTLANLQLNVKVKVTGRVNSTGVIEARKIEVKDGGRVVGSP
jgi:hypothetical protein